MNFTIPGRFHCIVRLSFRVRLHPGEIVITFHHLIYITLWVLRSRYHWTSVEFPQTGSHNTEI